MQFIRPDFGLSVFGTNGCVSVCRGKRYKPGLAVVAVSVVADGCLFPIPRLME